MPRSAPLGALYTYSTMFCGALCLWTLPRLSDVCCRLTAFVIRCMTCAVATVHCDLLISLMRSSDWAEENSLRNSAG